MVCLNMSHLEDDAAGGYIHLCQELRWPQLPRLGELPQLQHLRAVEARGCEIHGLPRARRVWCAASSPCLLLVGLTGLWHSGHSWCWMLEGDRRLLLGDPMARSRLSRWGRTHQIGNWHGLCCWWACGVCCLGTGGKSVRSSLGDCTGPSSLCRLLSQSSGPGLDWLPAKGAARRQLPVSRVCSALQPAGRRLAARAGPLEAGGRPLRLRR